MKYINLYSAHQGYLGSPKTTGTVPNVSQCVEEDHIHYNWMYAWRTQYVDFGLPSGNMWCKMNIGAANEFDAGMYFAWGETEGYYSIYNGENSRLIANGRQFTWSEYKFYTGDNNNSGTGSVTYNFLSKYNDVDELASMQAEDDIATISGGDVNGMQWHIPSMSDFIELMEHTISGSVSGGTFTYFQFDSTNNILRPTQDTVDLHGTVLDGKSGFIFFRDTTYPSLQASTPSLTDVIKTGDYAFFGEYGSSGAAEFYWNSICYWTADLLNTGSNIIYDNAMHLYYMGSNMIIDNWYRDLGMPIRPVLSTVPVS